MRIVRRAALKGRSYVWASEVELLLKQRLNEPLTQRV